MNCEHLQVLVANLLQRHFEWQEGRTGDVVLLIFRFSGKDGKECRLSSIMVWVDNFWFYHPRHNLNKQMYLFGGN